VNIAVIDTVALQQHQAIAKNILGGVPTSTIPGDYTDLNGHGVWVAAMAAGNQWVSPNGLETVGVAPEASLSLIKALGFVIGVGSDSSVIDAIGQAIARGAHIINMSLGSEQVPENLEDDPQAIAVKRATDAGILVMCAAGNSGPESRTINSPGAVEEAITVGSYNPVTGKISDFSSVGPTPDGRIKPDVVAPGENVFGPTVGMLDFALPPRGVLRASVLSGTSMATPAAAGIAALMYESAWRQGVRLTPAMFKDMMARYGEFSGSKSNYYGWGVPTWDIWERYAREVIGISV
jgi:subtilisin family serine protease